MPTVRLPDMPSTRHCHSSLVSTVQNSSDRTGISMLSMVMTGSPCTRIENRRLLNSSSDLPCDMVEEGRPVAIMLMVSQSKVFPVAMVVASKP